MGWDRRGSDTTARFLMRPVRHLGRASATRNTAVPDAFLAVLARSSFAPITTMNGRRLTPQEES